MTDKNETTETDALLERSSFGDEATRSLRERASQQQVDEVLRRAANLRHGEPDSTPDTPPADKGAAAAPERPRWPQVEDFQNIHDPLTNSYNRRHLDLQLERWLARSDRDLVVALVDVDGLRRINEAHGHLIGDRVLQQMPDLLRFYCARYGGDEFVLVFPGSSLAEVNFALELVRAKVERFSWGTVARGLRVTVSAGVVSVWQSGLRHVPTPHQLLARADAPLRAAKQSGGNAVAYRRGERVRLVGGREDFSESLTPEGSTT